MIELNAVGHSSIIAMTDLQPEKVSTIFHVQRQLVESGIQDSGKHVQDSYSPQCKINFGDMVKRLAYPSCLNVTVEKGYERWAQVGIGHVP